MKLVGALPENAVGRPIGNQLIRSARLHWRELSARMSRSLESRICFKAQYRHRGSPGARVATGSNSSSKASSYKKRIKSKHYSTKPIKSQQSWSPLEKPPKATNDQLPPNHHSSIEDLQCLMQSYALASLSNVGRCGQPGRAGIGSSLATQMSIDVFP